MRSSRFTAAAILALATVNGLTIPEITYGL